MNDQKASSAAPIVELRDATKSYGAVRALRDGNLSLRPGEVRALIGENGAGKSTLVKVLGGVVRRDAGEMLVDGEPVDFHSPHAARDAGIAVIYQEPTLFPDLSVAENVVMGFHPLKGLKRIDRGAMHGQVKGLLDRLGVRLDPERPPQKGKIKLTGLGFPNQMRKYVKDGTVEEFQLWVPKDVGYLAGQAAAALVAGRISGKEGEKFKAGRLGEYTIGANGEIVLGPLTTFKKDNIDKFDF